MNYLTIFIFLLLLFYKQYIAITALFLYIWIHKRKRSYQTTVTIQSQSDFNYYLDIQDCKQHLVSIIKNAHTTLYYSSYACNMLTPFYKHYNMAELLNAAADRGVQVFILYNTTNEYSNHTIQKVKQLLDSRITIYQVHTKDTLETSIQPIANQIGYSYNHMKFVLTESECMIGGCDIDPWERLGYEMVNKNNFSWHEISIAFTPSQEVYDYLTSLFTTQNIYNIQHPPSPLSTNIYEMKQYLWMIENSHTTLYIEHQLLAMTSYSKKWSSRFIQAIANRIQTSCDNKDSFVCTIITNVSQDDETSPFTQVFSKTGLILSICNIMDLVDCDVDEVLLRLKVYTLLNENKVPVKTHSNVIITDDSTGEYHAIRSSSNLSDRSFGTYSCDLELGIYIYGIQVKQLFFDLLSLHTHRLITDYSQIHISSPNSYLHPIPITCDYSLLQTGLFKITQTHSSSGSCKEPFLFSIA